MRTYQEENKSLSFAKRWITSFNRILRILGNKPATENTEFVDALLREDKQTAKTQEELDMLVEKRGLMVELCDYVDSYYQKKRSAEKAATLDDWFEAEVRTLVQDTIPEATQEDVQEIREILSKSMHKDIEVRSDLLKSEFSTEERATSENKNL